MYRAFGELLESDLYPPLLQTPPHIRRGLLLSDVVVVNVEATDQFLMVGKLEEVRAHGASAALPPLTPSYFSLPLQLALAEIVPQNNDSVDCHKMQPWPKFVTSLYTRLVHVWLHKDLIYHRLNL